MLTCHYLTASALDNYRSSAMFDSRELEESADPPTKVWGKVWGWKFPNLVIALSYKVWRPPLPGISYPRILR